MTQTKNIGRPRPAPPLQSKPNEASETDNGSILMSVVGSVDDPLLAPMLNHIKSAALLNTGETGQVLKLAPATLRNWRVQGRGPRWIRLSSRTVRYRLEDINLWVAARERRSTSEEDRGDADGGKNNGQ